MNYLVAEVPLGLGLEVGLVDELEFLYVDIPFAEEGLEVLLLVVDGDDGAAEL